MPGQLRHSHSGPCRALFIWILAAAFSAFSAVADARGDWVDVGSASTPDPSGYIQITPAVSNQAGAAWLDAPVDLSKSFDVTLLVNLGSRDGNGADGLSIVFQNDPRGLNAVGDTAAGGEWVGMHTIYPAVSVEIDTYENGSRGDPACDHVGINEMVNAASLPNHAGAGPVCAATDAFGTPLNIEDNADHSVRLLWNSATATLTVFFDGVEILDSDNPGHKVDVAAIVGTTPWFGVVGSTGGVFNTQTFKAIVTGGELVPAKSAVPSSVDPGDTVTYAVTLRNDGDATAFLTGIVDQLPAGFTYVPGSSAGLTTADPIIVGQTLTWGGNGLIQPDGLSTPVQTFQAQATMIPGVYFNNVTLQGSNFTDISTGNTARVNVGSNLSASTKSVVDLNGGDAWPNDILQYTITLTETAGLDATGIALTDVLAPEMTGLNIHLPLPPGSMNSSTGGQINISNITVPANGSVDVVFDVTIANGTPHGTSIDNTATITNPLGVGAAPSAPTVLVTNTTPPAAGTKPLYLYTNLDLSRLPAGPQGEVQLNGGDDATWSLAPSAYLPLTIDGSAGTIPVTLWISGGNRRYVTLTLSSNAGQIGALEDIPISSNGYGASPIRFDIPIADPAALENITSIDLNVNNVSTRSNRTVYIDPYRNGLPSRVDLESLTVIHVDSVQFYDAPFPAGSVISSTTDSGAIYIRVRVSDPFGSFDVSSATLTFTTPTGVDEVSNAAMTQVAADANGPYKTYELAYPSFPATWPVPLESGFWTATVTAQEGTEGLVRHTNRGTLRVLSPPDILLLKSVQTYSDPVNATTNPKAIPGAIVAYTISAQNQGESGADADSVFVIDPIPPNTVFCIGDLGEPWGPVAFIDTAPLSGLTFNPVSDLAFSMDGGSHFDLTAADLIDDGYGCDSRITHIQVNPKGVFNGTSGGPVPAFTLKFRVRVQ